MAMAYNPGALEAALAAAVGDEPQLIAELRTAFFESADAHVAALRYAASDDEWRAAAARLNSLAASFGAIRLMDGATAALRVGRGDMAVLNRIERTLNALRD